MVARERRSAWTGRPAAELIEVQVPAMTRWGTPAGEQTLLVEPKHEAELRRFVTFAVRNGRQALVLYLGSSVLCLAGALLGPAFPAGRWLLVGGLLLLGGSMVAYPFATPETVAAIGLDRSRRMARVAGLALVALAIGTAAVYASA